MADLPVNASLFVPHGAPMLLVDTLHSAAEGSGTISATMQKDSLVTDELGQLEPLACIELIAQGYAAVRGFAASRNETGQTQGPSEGFLVGVQHLSVHSTVHPGQEMTITVETIGEFEGFAVVQGRIECMGTLVAEAKLKVYAPIPVDGQTSGDTSGNTSGDTSGETSGNSTGATFGATSGQPSVQTVGNTPGNASGQASNQTFGQPSTTTPDAQENPNA